MNEKLHNKTNWLWKASPFIMALLFSLNVNAQSLTVNGKVTTVGDDSGLPGVNVIVKGTSVGTVTDVNGDYALDVGSSDAILVISSVGYLRQEVTVGSQSVINVVLMEDITALEEIVVIGYGTQKKSDLTGSVGVLKGDAISQYPSANATSAIQGRMAGVQVQNNGGNPGAAAIVTIRGSGTLTDIQPLYVIDGMLTGTMNMLNPNDIETVTVLKDASATAIYGFRAANGVIIITTKKGKKGELNINFGAMYGSQKAVKTLDWANARDYADIDNQAIDNDNARALAADPTATPMPYLPTNSTLFDPNIDSDLEGESLQTAPISEINFGVSGGGENSTFNVSVNRLKQHGIVKNSDYERMTLRTNAVFTKGKFKLEETIGLTRTIDNPNQYFNNERSITATYPLWDSEGNFTNTREDGGDGASVFNNHLGQATVEDRTITRNNVIGNLAGSYEIIPGLTYKLNLGLDVWHRNNYTYVPSNITDFVLQAGGVTASQLKEDNTQYLSWLLENTLAYNKVFGGKHNLGLLLGYSTQESNERKLGIVANDFPDDAIRVASQANVRAEAPSYDNTGSYISYFGRVNYTYDNRYLLTATIRRDGSSFFQEDNRWGDFPVIRSGLEYKQ